MKQSQILLPKLETNLKVRKSFSRASETYDEYANIQKTSAKLLALLANKYIDQSKYKKILDIGAGTGFLTYYLSKINPNSNYFLNDISIEMLDIAYRKFSKKPNFNYLNYDIEQEYGLNRFDLIASNFSLQWLNDLPKFLKSIKAPYLLAIPVHGTFSSWKNLLKENNILNSGLHYHQPKQILDILNSDNRKTHSFTKDYKIKFDNPLIALRHLQNIGAMASEKTINIKNLMSMVRNNSTTIDLEYKVLYIISL